MDLLSNSRNQFLNICFLYREVVVDDQTHWETDVLIYSS